MAKTVVGLFDTFSAAQGVVQDLVNAGFRREDISVVTNDEQSKASRELGGSDQQAADGAGTGAVSGTVVGGLVGLAVGAGLLAIPGIGPVLAAGPLAAAIGTTTAAVGAAAAGAGVGAAAGGLVGALVGAGIPDMEANYYSEGIRRGGTLVTVSAPDSMANQAFSVMQRHGAVNMEDRSSQWRKSGWERFDATGEPYQRGENNGNELGNDWEASSKVGTGTGAVAGAATGAAAGSVAGPVGTVVGGVVGAAVGGGVGAAGDVAGKNAEDDLSDPSYSQSPSTSGEKYGTAYHEETRLGDTGSHQSGGTSYQQADYSSYEQDFRTHYDRNFAKGTYGFDQYSALYRYGYNLGHDQHYANRDWNSLEPEIRRQWQERNPNNQWEDFKDAIRYAWDRARGK